MEDGEEVVVDNGGVAAMLLDDSRGVGLGNNELDESRVVVLNVDEADVDDDLNILVLDNSELVVVDEERPDDEEILVDDDEIAVVLFGDR